MERDLFEPRARGRAELLLRSASPHPPPAPRRTTNQTSAGAPPRAVRAALDIGSGQHKLLVAEVELGAVHGEAVRISRELYSEQTAVYLANDLIQEGRDGLLSDAILTQSFSVLARFRDIAER